MEPEERMSRELSVRSSVSNLSMQEEEDELVEKVYVAVGKEFKDWKKNLQFVLNNTNLNHKIVFVHVHQPSTKIPTALGYMLADKANPQELRGYRIVEKENMNKALKLYLDSCKAHKFTAIIKTIDNSDITKGLLDLVKLHKITNLIMGAASDKNHSKTKKEKAPKSKIAITMQQQAEPSCRISFAPKSKIAITMPQQAEPSCRISFVCKGELICVREAGQDVNNSILTHSQSMPPIQSPQFLAPSHQRSVSVNVGPSIYSSYQSELGNTQYTSSSISGSSIQYDNISVVSDLLPTTPCNNSPPTTTSINMMEDIFARLEDALAEIDRMKREANDESSRRRRAELDFIQTDMKLKAKESTLNKEMQKRAEIEEDFIKQRNELDHTLNELQELNDQKNSLQFHIRQLQGNLQNLGNCSEFSLLELKEATNNFDKRNKIGEGGYGSVYKGYLRYISVAIKVLNHDSIQGDEQFYQEVEILSRVRHPHLVTLIGGCLENRALIYELMPNMSLDNHLTNQNNPHPPLSWQSRVSIAREICLALLFLHSTQPQCIVHGDLKPENVLLDSNYVCKLSNFGICRQLNRTDSTVTPYHFTDHPKGSFPYMDPEYLSSGVMTPHYDVFSFGILLLQLVTGREARNIRSVLVEAAEQDKLRQVVDADWPFEVAKKMVHLGLSCSEPTRRKRPDLARDVLRVIEAITTVMPSVLIKQSLSEPGSALRSTSRSGNSVPSLFVCPLSKEIMVDPQIAADGYTYEAKDIKNWFNQGHNTSPITNMKFDSFKQVPNITLRTAIQDWLNQQLELHRQ